MDPANASTVGLFSTYLKSILPRSEYGKDPMKTASYQLVHGSLNGLKKWLANPSPERRCDQTAPLMPRRLTLLHLAAMLGKREEAKYLLSLREILFNDLNRADSCGWTVLHFACLIQDLVLRDIFLKAGAQPTLNAWGSIPDQITEMIQYKPDPARQAFYYEDKGEIKKGDGKKFCELTGAETFVDMENVISPQSLFEDWEKELSVNLQTLDAAFFAEQYEKMRNSESPVYIKKVEKIGWELCARQDIPAGTFIVEYLGKKVFKGEDLDNEKYLAADINAFKIRGLAACANDGRPNVYYYTMHKVHGLATRAVYMATETISKGTPIRTDYTLTHSIKLQPRLEANLEETIQVYRELAKQGPLFEQYLAAINKMDKFLTSGQAFSTLIPHYRTRSLIEHAFGTPVLLAILVLKGIVSSDDVAKMMDYQPAQSRVFSAEFNPGKYKMLRQEFYRRMVELPIHIRFVPQKEVDYFIQNYHGQAWVDFMEPLYKMIKMYKLAAFGQMQM